MILLLKNLEWEFLARSDRFLACQKAIQSIGEVPEIRRVAAGDLGRHIALVADVGKGAAHLDPVDVAVAEIAPGEAAVRPIELEVLEVDLRDARAKRADPVLRVAVEDDVADVEVGLQPRRVELVDVARELERAE